MPLAGLTLALLAMLAWSGSDLLSRFALRYGSRMRVLVIAQLVGGCAALAFGLHDISLALVPAGAMLILLGAINIPAMFAFYKSLESKGVALTTPIVHAWPIVTILLSVLFYSESPSLLQWGAIVFICAGIASTTFTPQKFSFDAAFLPAIIACVLFGVQFFAYKVPVTLFGAFVTAAFVKITTGILAIPFAAREAQPVRATPRTYALIAGVGLADATGFVAFNLAILDAPVSLVSAMTGAVPALSALLAMFLFKERISRLQGAGVGAVALGIVILSL